MRRKEFDKYYARYCNIITAIARKYGGRDDDLVADLTQEGALALWHVDPRIATSNFDAMARQAIKFRMIDYLRRNNPKVYESLDALLEAGNQLEKDPRGNLRLVSPFHPSNVFIREAEDTEE